MDINVSIANTSRLAVWTWGEQEERRSIKIGRINFFISDY